MEVRLGNKQLNFLTGTVSIFWATKHINRECWQWLLIFLDYMRIFKCHSLCLFSSIFKICCLKILSSQKTGGYRVIPFNSSWPPTPSQMFFFNTWRANLTTKNCKKPVSAFRGKKHGVILYVMFATKILMALCDVALQPLWQYIKDHHRSCDDTWSSATNLKKYSFLFSFVAKLHVSSQLQWRSLTYRHRLSRNLTYGSSFFGSMVYILDVLVQGLWRVVTFCADRQVLGKFVYIVYFFPAFSQRMYDMNGWYRDVKTGFCQRE